MNTKDSRFTFNWKALSTTRHLRNRGEEAGKKNGVKKKMIKKRGMLASPYPYSMSFMGRVWQQGKLFLRDLRCSQSSSSVSASLLLELPEHNGQRASSLCSTYTHHLVPKAEPKPEPLTSTTLQNGSKWDPVLTFILFFYAGPCLWASQLVQCNLSSSLTGELHILSSPLKQRAPTLPPRAVPNALGTQEPRRRAARCQRALRQQQQMLLPELAPEPLALLLPTPHTIAFQATRYAGCQYCSQEGHAQDKGMIDR